MNPKTYEELVEENKKLNEEIKSLKNTIENNQLWINQLQKYVFGPRRESVKKEENIVRGE